MNLAVIDLDNGLGDVILPIYMIGGVLLFITSFFPGNKIGWRIFSAVAGLGIAGWAGYVFLFGGTIIINLYIALLPFILAGKGIIALIKRSKEEPAPAAPTVPLRRPTVPRRRASRRPTSRSATSPASPRRSPAPSRAPLVPPAPQSPVQPQ
ncbi:hypothetical protein ACFQX7_17935 [Luedemannella flava]